ncbi:modifier of mdg4-like isoform X2 [Zootermopsis nevadensis]|uniref:Protein bric-a-brac 2 n=2 Tax=Zootermopsis nevadensis TaxID=136037 RepID=A0A067R8K9_ZOONE|nr:modifier of mdg4-like isoform X2 [Zootermopsis nevadensis]KDR15924.1 Protein bric-a-brac 2 [Zootermopsis nevadensis]
MSTRPQHYCLKWNNYQSHVAEIFTQLLQAESMVDVTLCTEGQKIHAHRIVLSACSPYFQDILTNTEDSHPYIILSEMSSDDVRSIVEFIYRGELNVGADHFSSVLKIAEVLQIRGLMEVSNHLPMLGNENSDESNPETLSSSPALEGNPESNHCLNMLPDVSQTESVDIFVEASERVHEEPSTVNTKLESKDQPQSDKKDEDEKKKKHRRETSKKYYSEDMLLAALEDLRAGRALVETAATYRIPRSTLYVRARAQGIPLTITRQEHSGERVQAAVQAVAGGASLQQAAELFKIPKTVLWRRVQKEMGSYAMSRRARMKQSYGLDKKQAAVKALERGENLTKVSHQFQIPKTTLFREKVRLVEAGRLPWSCLRKRDPDIGGFKQHRLREAVAACKKRKMSQAVASVTFQVPKTTIWRKLQQGSRPESAEPEESDAVVHLQERTEFSFSEVSTQIPVTYIDESDFSEASLIILTAGSSESMEEQIIVDRDSMPDEGQESRSSPMKEVPSATNCPSQNTSSAT